jgi:hypothetical protein
MADITMCDSLFLFSLRNWAPQEQIYTSMYENTLEFSLIFPDLYSFLGPDGHSLFSNPFYKELN